MSTHAARFFMQALGLRPYVIEEYTKTVCPHCFAQRARRSDESDVWKDGMLVSHDGSVWLRRFCCEHGETESLYEEDAALWRARQGWSTPTSRITPDRADNFKGFPDGYRDGLPASHGQHTCILVLNITDRCNYGCTTCYAAARAPGTPVPRLERPTIDDIIHTVETVIAREGGKLSVLMLSGGEPTVRDDLPQIILRLAALPITRVLINTNGRRIARDPRFVQFLHEFRHRIEVYLQFDGVRPATYRALRNEDVSSEKMTALKHLSEAGIFTTLVATVARGVNEEEIGDVARLGMETPRCSGLALQPMFGSGRSPGFDAQSRATPTGILRRLEEQTRGLISASDFIPLPCSHKDCCDITYLVQTASGKWKSIPELIGREELKRWIHLVSNTISFDNLSEPLALMLKSGALGRVFSEQMPAGTPQLMRDLAGMCDCVPGLGNMLGGLWKIAAPRVKTSPSPASTPRMSTHAREHNGMTPFDTRNGDHAHNANAHNANAHNANAHLDVEKRRRDEEARDEHARLEQIAERTFRITTKMFMDAHTFHEARLRQCCVHTGTFEDDPRRHSFCWRWLFADATDTPQLETARHNQPQTDFVPIEELRFTTR